MDIIESFLLGRLTKVDQPQQEQEEDAIGGAFAGLLQLNDKPKMSDFEEQLVYGINVTTIDKNGRKHFQVCYLHEDSLSLICFIEHDSKFVVVLDVKNMDLTDDDQMLEARNPLLSTQPYLCLRETAQQIVLIFTEADKRNAMSSNFRMMRLKLNFLDPHDEEFAIAKKQFVCESDTNKTIDVGEFRRITRRIGYSNEKFNEAAIKITRRNSANTGVRITYTEFMEFLRLSYCTPIIYDLFNKCVQDKLEYYRNKPNPLCVIPIMTKQQFGRFLMQQQREPTEKIDSLIRSSCLFVECEAEQEFQTTTTISAYVFGRFIFSNENSLLDPAKQVIYQDMSHPLNHYYCYSSHNTYLTGNQLTSKSKVQRYVEDLERGLKCVEIDVHESFGKIIVKHGYTPTSSILFQDVIKVIRNFSDQHPGHLPIIVSLEVHLDPKMREKMAQIILNHLYNKILLIEKGFKFFPSPMQLKGKIVIKTDCRMDPNLTLEQIEHQQEDEADIQEEVAAENDKTKSKPPKKKKRQAEREKELEALRHQWVTKESSTMLSKLTGLYKGHLRQESSFCENVSLDWSKLIEQVRKDPQSVVSYTSRSWLRVYPHGAQVLSSNYNPIPMMEVGAQIIALNTQVRDTFYYLLHAHFRENCCGYLLKPEELRTGKGLVREQSVKLQLKIVASMNIRNLESYEEFRYHVNIGFFGSDLDDTPANDMRNIKQVTEDVTEEDAVFQSSQPLYYIINQVYFAFFFFEVDGFGKTAVPVRMMRQGYRALPLLNRNFQPIGASYLLVHVAFEH